MAILISNLKKAVYAVARRLPLVKSLEQQAANSFYPNGHYYSPVISISEVKSRETEIWKPVQDNQVKGVNLNTSQQLSLLSAFSKTYQEMDFPESQSLTHRYYFQNQYYSYTDGVVLYSMMRHFSPGQIIEIGSGFSSALMLDVNERYLNLKTKLTFIEPFPERLRSLLKAEDHENCTIIEKKVQDVDLDVFERLEPNDFLFIDSTHVSKTGSDVNQLVFEVLPRLKSGVLIHVHDIFYPFEYPQDWVLKGFNWNENYILRSFLMYNTQFEIIVFSDYLHRCHPGSYKDIPLCYKNTGGSIWIRKK